MFTSHEIQPAEHLAWWGAALSDPRRRYLVCESAGEPIGVIGFTELDLVNRTASWLMYSGRLDQRGLGRRMELAALDHAFGPLGLEKLWGEGLTSNTAVLSLHRRFGFRIEGLFRNHVLHDGTRCDVWRIGMLREEWEHTRPLVEQLLAQKMTVEGVLALGRSETLLARAAECVEQLAVAQLDGRGGVTRIELRPLAREVQPQRLTTRLTWSSTIGGQDVVSALQIFDETGLLVVEGEVEVRMVPAQGAVRAARGAISVAKT